MLLYLEIVIWNYILNLSTINCYVIWLGDNSIVITCWKDPYIPLVTFSLTIFLTVSYETNSICCIHIWFHSSVLPVMIFHSQKKMIYFNHFYAAQITKYWVLICARHWKHKDIYDYLPFSYYKTVGLLNAVLGETTTYSLNSKLYKPSSKCLCEMVKRRSSGMQIWRACGACKDSI